MSTLSGTTSKSQWPFSPQSIPGLSLWLDAADTSSLVLSGTSVTTWKDKSGLGNNATTGGGSSAITTSATGLTFDRSGYMSVPGIAGTLVNTPFVIFVVETLNGANQNFFFGEDSTSHETTNQTLHIGYRNSSQTTFAFWANDLEDTGLSGVGNMRIWGFYLPTASNRNTRRNGAVDVTHTNYTRLGQFTNPVIGRIIGDSATYGYSGTISEIIVYTNDIGLSNIQQVEGFLAQKWGMQPNLPATHPYYAVASTPAGTPIAGVSSPTAISNLALWLDGRDPAGTGTPPSNGATVSTWVDKSGLGLNATASGTPQYTTNSINGYPSIYLSNGPYFTGSVSITGATLTCFAVAITNAALPKSGSDQRLVSLENGGNVDYGRTDGVIALFNQSTTSTIATYRVSGPLANNTITTNTPFLAVSQYDGTNAYLWFNGSAGTLPYSVSGGNFGVTKYGIGNQANPTTEYWYGYIGEVIIYTSALSSSDRKSVEVYLENKWGITQVASGGVGTPAVQASQLYKSPVFQRTFSPVDISGCSLWMDGADPSSMTFSSGTTMSGWKDKSGNGFNATAVNSPQVISTGGVSFNGSAYFTLTATYSQTSSFFLVGSSSTGGQKYFFNFGATNSGTTLIGNGEGSGYLDLYSNNTGWGRLSTSYTVPFLVSEVQTSGGPISGFYNGTQQYTATYTAGSASTISVIGAAINNGESPLTGTIYEFIVYNSALSSSQRQQVESYLAWKWGLVSNLPTSPVHPGKTLPAFSTVFTPKSISGISLWLDAADYSTLTLSSTSVSQWNDKSGAGRNVTQSPGLQPTYSSTLNAIVFNANSYLNIPDALNSITPTYTIFVVERRTAGGTNFFVGQHDLTSGNTAVILGYNGSTISDHTTVYITDCLITIPTYAGASEPVRINRYDYSGTTRSTFINGGQYSQTQSFSATLPVWSNANIGAGFSSIGSGYWYIGNIYEIIFYKNVLTTSQAQQVEGYLAWKWGLVTNLPGTHGFKNIKP